MNVNKLDIGGVYAILHRGSHVRFKIDSVLTRRNSDHLTVGVGEVYGHILGLEGAQTFKVKPAEILGRYTEYMELVAEAEREKQEAYAARQAMEREAQILRQLLLDLIGDKPDVAGIRSMYTQVTIEQPAVKRLVEILTKQAEDRRFGQPHHGHGLCVVCHVNTVDAEAGFDTCESCRP